MTTETKNEINAELKQAEKAYDALVRQVASGDKAETGETLTTIRAAGKTTEQFWSDVEEAGSMLADEKALAEGQRIRREVVPAAGRLIQKSRSCREQIELLVRAIVEGPLAESQRQELDALNYGAACNAEWVALTQRPNLLTVPNHRRAIASLQNEIKSAFSQKVAAEPGCEGVIDSQPAAAKEKLARLEADGPQFKTETALPKPPEIRDVLADFVGPIVAAFKQSQKVDDATQRLIEKLVAEKLSDGSL
jgi:hypothetical protein